MGCVSAAESPPDPERAPDRPSHPSPTAPIDRRFPRTVFSHGGEPDPRFTLANERTFLAWIRTALALVAGGVALDAVALPVAEPYRIAATVVLLVLGVVMPWVAWFTWARTERAMRERRPLPGFRTGPLLLVGITVAVVLVGVGMLLA